MEYLENALMLGYYMSGMIWFSSSFIIAIRNRNQLTPQAKKFIKSTSSETGRSICKYIVHKLTGNRINDDDFDDDELHNYVPLHMV